MKVSKYSGSEIRKILVGMATDRTVCARISGQWASGGLFDSEWANLVGGLMVDYFRRYGSPPNGQMTSLFEAWARESAADEKHVDLVEHFLHYLNDTRQDESPDYVLDLAGRYFNKVSLERELVAAGEDLKGWRVEEAQTRLERIRKVNLGKGSFVEPGSDLEFWLESAEENQRPLVRYREALGDFIGDGFLRGTFFSFMGPDKSGKTRWLLDLVYRSLRNRQRVAYFELGDGTRQDFSLRMRCRVLRQPKKGLDCLLPVGWKDEVPQCDEQYLDAADPTQAALEFAKLIKDPASLRLVCHPSGTATVADIDSTLAEWDSEGWRPTVVILDYADILAPPKGVKDKLEQIDENWVQLRRISQSRYCLLVTATQTASSAYARDGKLLTKEDFGGRKTKLAHVNGMLGINVWSEDKKLGVTRINWVVRRGDAQSDMAYCCAAGCSALEDPASISTGPFWWKPKAKVSD